MSVYKRGGRYLASVVAFILAAIMLTAAVLPCAANSKMSHMTLRVAYSQLDGFFEYDDSGNEIGYGVELLEKISQYTGINFKYVHADSWEETKPMLLDGQADLRMPATPPTTPSTTLSYNGTSIIDTYNVILALKSRDDLYYQDYETIRTLKIAVSESFCDKNGIRDYLNSIGVAESQVVLCEEYNDCYEMLQEGKVDALISNIMDLDDSMKMLSRFDSVSNYFSMTLDNPALETLDNAIAQIKLDEPLFLPRLYEKWFPERTTIPLTLEENEFLASQDTLTFAFRENEGYLSRYENGEFYGIYVEQAKLVCEKLGVDFNAVSLDACLAGNGSADIYCGFFYDKNFAEQWDFAISSPINDINYYYIQKKEVYVDDTSCKIAAIAKFNYTKEYLQKKYRADQFIYFDTYEECLQAVADGRADLTVINNYIAEYYLEMYQYSDLSARLTSEYSHFYCFATVNDNETLATILSKALSAISDEEMNQLYIRGVERKPDSNFMLAFLYRYPMLCMLIAMGIAALLIAVVLMLIFVRKSKKQNAVLEKALCAKSDFLARMSHDMRTPLNAVLGFTRLARDEKDDAGSVQDCITKIESSGEYLLGLINDVLDASKLDSGKVELHYEVVNGPDFLNEIAEELKAQGALKGITLVTNLEKADTAYVKMDKLRSRQIYTNLINNAFKFSEPGSTVEWSMEDTQIDETHMEFVTTITDHGCGMSEEFMKHMFEPFTQENQPDKSSQEGTGLGLTIVKKFVELSGGTISVESKLGEGTTFTLHMKRELPTQEEIDKLLHSQRDTDMLSLDLKGRRILLCEDHPLNREIAIRVLKKAGVTVDSAENGLIGAQMFEASAPGYYDAILMDVRMPVMDGLEAARKIRASKHPDSQTIPIVAVTANAYSEDMEAALKAGMNTHLPKPIDANLLYKTLSRLITRGKDENAQ